MRSIGYLIAIIMLNLFLKNIQEKRKTEDTVRKKMSQSREEEGLRPEARHELRPRQEAARPKKKEPSLMQEIYDLLNEEVEKKTQGSYSLKGKKKEEEKKPLEEKPKKRPSYQKEEWVGSQAKVTESAYKDYSAEHYSRGGHRDLDEEKRIREEERKKAKAAFKEDILKGIIFSEILSEPKALKRK